LTPDMDLSVSTDMKGVFNFFIRPTYVNTDKKDCGTALDLSKVLLPVTIEVAMCNG
jgi:hypothetical protein